ncbi:sensor histidine kinase [Sediminibacillus massiliensis]|uniref:sensor histidine kinase n=1 Tax=Sediminibacillus massiliensis TaxID=1926277 RepID=UPI0009884729|nr:HAMP domain-containing sensor histidine kinase [Sediminibacillus massiliensis]
MLRNREVGMLLFAMCFITLLGTVIAAVVFSYLHAILVFLTATSLVICSILFTRWRYKEIEKLSSYLRQISNGDYSLDVRNNLEGELSILKNDIYKVTIMLSEQGSMLNEDKVKLTNAISDISHQLKTPLTSMTVMADLLSDNELPETKRKEFTQNIRKQLERIEWLVSSLLKLSKIDAGTAMFKNERTYVKDVIQKAIDPMLIPIDIKEQTIEITGEESAVFTGDLNWTAEAVLNILKNCVEHTGNGGKLTLSYAENPIFTEIYIRDNGKGIPKEDIPYIFQRFYKGKNAGEGSVGIGLAMAYSIVKSQNGSIEVTSHTGEGTTFHIKFYKQVI